MNLVRLNRLAATLPLVFSGLAFGLVMSNILVGVRPSPDEDATAHLWQLLVAGQLPLIVLFVATADWRNRASAMFLGAQVLGLTLACAPVWLAGY
jgi:hypothetical protein